LAFAAMRTELVDDVPDIQLRLLSLAMADLMVFTRRNTPNKNK
jgi:hypothetical protein